MKNSILADEWFEIAEKDYTSAKFLCTMKPLPMEIICYHCEQAAEKLLKGFIAFNGGELIKTHDLILLNKQCIRFDKDFSELIDHCIELTDYSVNIRYPYHMEISEDDVAEALRSMEFINNFIKNKIINKR